MFAAARTNRSLLEALQPPVPAAAKERQEHAEASSAAKGKGSGKGKPGAGASARPKPLRLIDERCDEGYTALQVACARGSVHAVRDALRGGSGVGQEKATSADVALKDVESGWSALHHALYHGNLGCALVLLEALRGRLKGADSSAAFAPDSLGEALFHGAGSGASGSGAASAALHSTSSPGVAAAVLGPALLLDDALDPLAFVRRVRTSRRDASRWGQPLHRAPYATTADAPTLGLPVNDREGLTPLDLLTLRRAPHIAAVRAMVEGLRAELRRRPALVAPAGSDAAPAGSTATGQASSGGKKRNTSSGRAAAASPGADGDDSEVSDDDGVHASGVDWDDPANWDLSDFEDIDWGDARLSNFGQRSARAAGGSSSKGGRARKAGGRGGGGKPARRGIDDLDEAEFDRQLAEILGQRLPGGAEHGQSGGGGGGKKGRGRRRETGGGGSSGGGAGAPDGGALETGLFTRFADSQAENEGQTGAGSGGAAPPPQTIAEAAAPEVSAPPPASPATPDSPRLAPLHRTTSPNTVLVPRSIEFLALPTVPTPVAFPPLSSADNRPRWMTTLLSYGRADMQLGYATTGDVVTHPRPIEFPEEVEAAAAALNAEAEAGAGGGAGEAPDAAAPPLPPRALGLEGNTVVAMAAAKSHTMVVTADGALYGWGVNSAAQLGLGGAPPTQPAKGGAAAALSGAASAPGIVVTPTRIPLRVRVVAVAAGKRHTLAVGVDGSLYAWGDNRSGACGWPAPAGSSGTGSASNNNGSAAAGSTLQRTPRRVEGGLKKLRVLACAAGGHHSLAVTSDGGVWAWGSNLAGQLGVKDVPTITTLMPQAAYASVSTTTSGAGDGWLLSSAPVTPSSTASSSSGGAAAAGSNSGATGGGSDFAAVPPEVLAACIGWTPRRTDLSTPSASGSTLPSAAAGLSFQALAGLGRADTPAVRVTNVAAGDTFSLALSKSGDVHCAGHGSAAWSRLRFEAAVAAQEDAIAAIQEGAWAVAKATPAEALGPTPAAALSAAAACAEVQALAERGFRVDVPTLPDAGSGFGGSGEGSERGPGSGRGARERAASASGDHEAPAIWLRQKGGRGGGPSVPISSLAAGKHHAIAVDADGGVWTWGAASRAGLLGHTTPVAAAAAVGLPPTALTFPGALSDLLAAGAGRGAAAGGQAAMPPSSPALSSSGSSSGLSSGATSGFWFLEPWGTPRRVSTLWRAGYRAARAAAGLHGCAVVTRCGDLLAWGEAAGGDRGLLGHGTGRAGQAPVPRKVVGVKGAIDVTAGDHHTLVLTALVLPPLPPPLPTETAIAEALHAAVSPVAGDCSAPLPPTVAPIPRARVVVAPTEGAAPVSEASFPGLDPPTVYRAAAEDAAHTGRVLCEVGRRAEVLAGGSGGGAAAAGGLSPRALLHGDDSGTALYTGATGFRSRAGTSQLNEAGEPVQALDTLFAEVLTLTTAVPAAGGGAGEGAAPDAAPQQAPVQPTLPPAMNGAGSEGETFRGVFEAVEDVRHRASTGGALSLASAGATSLTSPGGTHDAFRPGTSLTIPAASSEAEGSAEATYTGSCVGLSSSTASSAAPGAAASPRVIVTGVQQHRFVPSLKSLAQRAVARCISPAAAPQWLAWASQHGAATLAAYCGALLHANADALLAAMYLTGRNTGLGARERDRELLVSPEVADGLIWGGWTAPGRADRLRSELVASEASTARLYSHMQAVHTRMLRPAYYSGANADALPTDAPLSPSMVSVLGHDAALLRRRLFPFDFVDEDGVVRNTGAAPQEAQPVQGQASGGSARAGRGAASAAAPAPVPAPAPAAAPATPVISATGISVVATSAPAPAPAPTRATAAAPVAPPAPAPLALAFDVPAPVATAFTRVLRIVGDVGVAPPPAEPALLRFLTDREGYKNHSYWRGAAAAAAPPVAARSGRKGDGVTPCPLDAAVEDIAALFKRAKATRKKVIEAAQLAVTVVTHWYAAKFGSGGGGGGKKGGSGGVKGPGAGLYDADQGAKLAKRGVLIDELWTLTRLLIAVLGVALPSAARGGASTTNSTGEQGAAYQLRGMADVVTEAEAFLASVAPLLACGLGPEGSSTHDTSDVLTAKAMLEALGRGANAEEVVLSTVLGAAAVVGPLAAALTAAPATAKISSPVPAPAPAPAPVTSVASGGAGAEASAAASAKPGAASKQRPGAPALTAATTAKGHVAIAPPPIPAPAPPSKLGLRDLMSVEAAAAERRKAVEAEAARAKLATLKATAAAEKAAAAAEAALAARVKSAFHGGAQAAPAAAAAAGAGGRRSLADIQAEQAKTGGSGGGGPPAATMANKSSQVWSVYSVRQGAGSGGSTAPPPPAAGAASAAVDFWGGGGGSSTPAAAPRPPPAKPTPFPALGSLQPKKK